MRFELFHDPEESDKLRAAAKLGKNVSKRTAPTRKDRQPTIDKPASAETPVPGPDLESIINARIMEVVAMYDEQIINPNSSIPKDLLEKQKQHQVRLLRQVLEDSKLRKR